MHRAIEATIAKDGKVRLNETISLPHDCRAIVTILDDLEVSETSLLSEQALGADWEKPQEDKAWAHFQKAR